MAEKFRHIESDAAGANDGYLFTHLGITEQHIDITQGFFVPDPFDVR